MNRKIVDFAATASLIFAPILILAYVYLLGPISAIGSPMEVVPSLLSSDIISLQNCYPIISTVVAAAIIIYGAMLNVAITTRYNLFGTASRLPIVLYVVLIVGFSTSSNILSPAIAGCVGTFALLDFFRAYENSGRTSKLFTGCFWLGVLPLLYPTAIVLWVVAFALLILFVRSLRDIAVVIVGLILPIAATIYVRWLFGADIKIESANFLHSLTYNYPFPTPLRMSHLVYSVSLAAISAILALFSFMQIERMSIRFVARTRLYSTLLFILLATLTIPMASFSVESLVVVASPISIAVTPALSRLRWWISIPIYIAMLLLASSILLWVL